MGWGHGSSRKAPASQIWTPVTHVHTHTHTHTRSWKRFRPFKYFTYVCIPIKMCSMVSLFSCCGQFIIAIAMNIVTIFSLNICASASIKVGNLGLDMVVHSCNPSYSEGRDVRIPVWGQPDEKKLVTPSFKKQAGQGGSYL
jgi:hypothetical protein